MFYKNYFTRSEKHPNFKKNLYTRRITSATQLKQQDVNLFADCFSHHVKFDSPDIHELKFDPDSTTRYLTRDSLSAYFINEIYETPKIFDIDADQEVDFDIFLEQLVESSFASNSAPDDIPHDRYKLGTNRLFYLVGNVGEGKSAFIKKVISLVDNRKTKIHLGYSLLTVYMDLEEWSNNDDVPKPLKDNFLSDLYHQMFSQVRGRKGFELSLNGMMGVDPSNDPKFALKELIYHLKRQGIRLLLFIDNLDFYHYYYARYAFFEEYNKQQERSINENIMWLLSVFNSNAFLGTMGLNVMVAAREYVYEDIAAKYDGTKTDIDTARAIRLVMPVNPEEAVMGTRLALMAKAIETIAREIPGAADNLRLTLDSWQLKLLGKDTDTRDKSPIRAISRLGQHGNRSLVAFFSSLNIGCSDNELIERFFVREVFALYILYLNNMCKKYTQKENHFPNLFLVDCVIMDGKDFPVAHKPHMHTYWLKFFMLKYIVRMKKVNFREIMDIFHVIGKYDDHLVRHVTGSLCTANEFRCAEIDSSEGRKNFEAWKIMPTARGEFLFQKMGEVDVCFEFNYLQVIVDDQWLCLPSKFSHLIYLPEVEYSYLYATTISEYVQGSFDTVMKKARSVLHFMKVLEASFLIEIKEGKPALYQTLLDEKLIPDFDSVNDNIIQSVEHILKALGKDATHIGPLKRLREHLSDDVEYEEFFREYYDSGIEVSL